MGKDARGWRCKFAVVAPSTNTIVQPDMDDLRVLGVTNHFGRIYVPNMKVGNDDEFIVLVEAISAKLNDAVDRCLTSEPDYLIMGMNLIDAKRIAVISPYFPISDKNVTLFFQDCGFEVVRFRGLKCSSPVAIAQVSESALRDHVAEMNGDDVDAFVQVGTNLSMCELCGELEVEYGKPFVAINAATYWHSLRAMGINDQFSGHGQLFEKY